MNFKFFIISILAVSIFVGTAFAQQVVQLTPQEFTQEEINKMKNTAVHLTTERGTIVIEFYPEDAPNTVHNFLKLVESGFYDGVVFHRIIEGFMIQAGDPNTKDLDYDRGLWGSGGPGYQIQEEFNTLQHDRGAVSMARQHDPDSAGSQFFIVHKDSNFLDKQYTVFGRIVPGTYSHDTVNHIANLKTDDRDAPIDVKAATIIKAEIIYPFATHGLGELDRYQSIIKEYQDPYNPEALQDVQAYYNQLHDITFHVPYRWDVVEREGDFLTVKMIPGMQEHNAQQTIAKSGFTPQVVIGSENRTNYEVENNVVGTSNVFSIGGGDDPKILSNFIIRDANGVRAHLIMTTQNIQTEQGPKQFKVLQLYFNNLETNYSIIYVNTTEFFRYEVNAFSYTVNNFHMMIDGEMQRLMFGESPVFQQLMKDAKAVPEPEPLPPARIGGCLIATASYGSELAPQVQLLREIRDNTVLQTQSGESFMNGFNHIYYSFSPTIADYERENPVFKEAVKLTLTPLLASLTLLQHTDIDS